MNGSHKETINMPDEQKKSEHSIMTPSDQSPKAHMPPPPHEIEPTGGVEPGKDQGDSGQFAGRRAPGRG